HRRCRHALDPTDRDRASHQNRALLQPRQHLGPEHPDTLGSLNDLAMLYGSQDRYEEAEPLLQKALRLRTKVLGPEHPDTLGSLNNLALSYRAQERYGEAEPLFQKALQLREKVLGPEHPNTLGSRNDLAVLYHDQDRYEDAEPLFQKAFQLREKVLGPEHPDTLASLGNLAELYRAQGRYEEAEPLFQKVLQLSEKVLGLEHPKTLAVQSHFVLLRINQERIAEALTELQRMEPRLLRRAGAELYTTDQAQGRRRLLVSLSDFQDLVLTLATRHPSPSPEAVRLAVDVVLRWKQVMGEEEAYLAALAQHSQDPRIRQPAAELAELRNRLPGLDRTEQPTAEILEEIDQKEAELARVSRLYATHLQTQTAGIDQVRSVLPRTGSALLELKHYWPLDFKRGHRLNEPHWAALLVRADEAPKAVDLGPASESNSWWEGLNQAADAGSAKVPAARLYKSLFGQLDEQLRGIETLYLAPDQHLHLVPFDRLVVADGRYWVERQSLRLLQTGRDLLRPLQTPASDMLLALGGVDFDFPAPANREAMASASGSRKANAHVLDALSTFALLKASAEEAAKIARLYLAVCRTHIERYSGGAGAEG
ncbi:MAG: CHAT domain-containing protein, partial [Acidobacteria bacterium]|nr:CHAT domain-containing protein [Acidobacteriota bacterium]